MKKILITGANGFIGKNLLAELTSQKYINLFECLAFDLDLNQDKLDSFVLECDFIMHLAGINRPSDPNDFIKGNIDFTKTLIDKIVFSKNIVPILVTSSIQADLDNLYGQSKKAGENLILEYGKKHDVKTFVYRLPNVFGKWSKPNYNSVIATFCHNVSHDLSIQVNDENRILDLVYIDDVIQEFICSIDRVENLSHNKVTPIYSVKLGDIAKKIEMFKEIRFSLTLPNMSDDFEKKLYSTYLSYLPKNHFIYDLKMNTDDRGSFTEFIKTVNQGQVSINISKVGIVKGNHWHHTKNEKFLVVSGKAVIRFRKIGTSEIFKYFVSGEKLQVVDIPTGYTHNIENIGNTDLVTVMWANEAFDPSKPDTNFLEVNHE